MTTHWARTAGEKRNRCEEGKLKKRERRIRCDKVIDWSLAQTNFQFDWNEEEEEEDWIEMWNEGKKITLRLLTLKIPTVAQPGKRICCAQWTDYSARNTHTHTYTHTVHTPCYPVASMTRAATQCLCGLCSRVRVCVCTCAALCFLQRFSAPI